MSFLLLDQFVLVGFLAIVAWAAVRDAVDFTIPDAASLAIAALYPIHLLAAPLPIDWPGALLTSGAIFVCGFCLFARGYLGGGDVKLLTATALWAGPQFILPLLLTMGLSGGALAALVWSRHRVFGRLAPVGAWGGTIAQVPYRLQYGIYGVALSAGASVIGLCRRRRFIQRETPTNPAGAAIAAAPLRLPYGVAIATGASLVGLRLLIG
jgi:prepilin peptidase CpaA